MKFKKVPFPRYLNRPRLWIGKEEDEWLVILITSVVVIGLLFMLAVPLFVLVFLWLLSIYISNHLYIKIVKETAPGFLQHYFYHLGLHDPNRSSKDKDNQDFRFPYGFERNFRD
jgi:hypothetical protein